MRKLIATLADPRNRLKLAVCDFGRKKRLDQTLQMRMTCKEIYTVIKFPLLTCRFAGRSQNLANYELKTQISIALLIEMLVSAKFRSKWE
jgi:hypothetical protein